MATDLEQEQYAALEQDLYGVLAKYDNVVQYLGLQALAARYAVLMGQTAEQSQGMHLRMRAVAEQDPQVLALLAEMQHPSELSH